MSRIGRFNSSDVDSRGAGSGDSDAGTFELGRTGVAALRALRVQSHADNAEDGHLTREVKSA